MNIRDLILYENENTSLDFKAKEYWKKDSESLLKDTISMVNSRAIGNKYIIIGVKDRPGPVEEREILGLDEISDQANLENIIQENIEPLVNFRYYTYVIENKNVGVLEFYDNDNPPYMLKKKFGRFESGSMWIRQGSRQSAVSRDDIDYYRSISENKVYEQNIKVGFTINTENVLKLNTISGDVWNLFPSVIKKSEYEEKLNRLKDFKSGKLKNETNHLLSMFNEYNEKEESITMFKDSLGFSTQWNEEEILENIEKLPHIYYKEDYYYLMEKCGLKLNFYLYNDSEQFLEDVKVKFYFSSKDMMIAETLPKKPVYHDPLLGPNISAITQLNTFDGYPNVVVEKDEYVVEEYIDSIRHKEPTKLFEEPLRMVDKVNSDQSLSVVRYIISAKNLKSPLEGELEIHWIHK